MLEVKPNGQQFYKIMSSVCRKSNIILVDN